MRRFKMKEHVEFSIFDGISILIDTAGYQQALESANNLNKQVL
ncbi:hypothetical protein JCM19236_5822 [Vibrio sp. JCM 19236]|nr:hypothetical protein JCM19236_5822 [Vibrio sp. JCM 19236]